jgi:hypothetical protein
LYMNFVGDTILRSLVPRSKVPKNLGHFELIKEPVAAYETVLRDSTNREREFTSTMKKGFRNDRSLSQAQS